MVCDYNGSVEIAVMLCDKAFVSKGEVEREEKWVDGWVRRVCVGG